MPEAAVPESAFAKQASDTAARHATIRLLRVMAVAALLLPLLLFGFGSWLAYRSTQALAKERIERSLDVLQEHALKVFQSMNLALDTIDDLARNFSATEIVANGQQLHERLRQIQAALPEVQSIWLFGPDGHPQVITREYPAPADEDFSQLDYFTVPRDGQPGVYIGGIHQSVSGGQPYFTFNRARRDADGKFLGVIEMSLLPSDFNKFYARLVASPGLDFAMLLPDGTLVARFPAISGKPRLTSAVDFTASSWLIRPAARSPTPRSATAPLSR